MKLTYNGEPVKLEPVFAEETDARQLRDIFRDYGMDLSGPIHHHVVVRDGTTVIGGAKLVQLEPDFFFLEVIGVRQNYWHQGYGSDILTNLTGNPWQYCRQLKGNSTRVDCFSIGTIAKGSAQTFYRSHGFLPVSLSALPEPYSEQCIFCPDRDYCNPTAMIFTGTRTD